MHSFGGLWTVVAHLLSTLFGCPIILQEIRTCQINLDGKERDSADNIMIASIRDFTRAKTHADTLGMVVQF